MPASADLASEWTLFMKRASQLDLLAAHRIAEAVAFGQPSGDRAGRAPDA
jgi:hypothetical protein